MRYLFLFLFAVFSCFAACGGKVVLDTTGGTGSGTGGAGTACTTYCNALQSAGCPSASGCQAACTAAFGIGDCQSDLSAALECTAAAIAQSGNCTPTTLSQSCQQAVIAVSNCESASTGVSGGTGGTFGSATSGTAG
jgi:hypothetical protein